MLGAAWQSEAWRGERTAFPSSSKILTTLTEARSRALEAILRRVAARGWPKRRWRINVVRCRAATQGIVVNFNLLSDGSYVPASYRRLDGSSDVDRDRAIIEESIVAFADAAAKLTTHGLGGVFGPAVRIVRP